MSKKKPSLRILTLDNFYESNDLPGAGQAFLDVVALRSVGFGAEYPRSFLPLDKVDFFARHQIIYLDQDGKSTPVGCYKQVLRSRCDRYAYEFPLVSFMKSTNAMAHLQALELVFQNAKNEDFDVLYGGGLTVKKEFRQDPEKRDVLHEIVTALLYRDFLDFGKPVCMTAAAVRFKVHHFFEKIGYGAIEHSGKVLSTVPIVSAANEPTLIMKAERMTAHAEGCYVRHRDLIDSRLWIKGNIDETSKAA